MHDRPTLSPTSQSAFLTSTNAHQVFIIGLGDSGQDKIKNDLLTSAYTSSDYDYQTINLSKLLNSVMIWRKKLYPMGSF
jgi:cAMP phosphodiesterase